jgi:hypothetical protein
MSLAKMTFVVLAGDGRPGIGVGYGRGHFDVVGEASKTSSCTHANQDFASVSLDQRRLVA